MMNVRPSLLAAVAAGALLASGAHAAPAKKHAHHAVKKTAHKATGANNGALSEEVRALRAEVAELRSRLDATSSTQTATSSQIEAATSQAAAAQATAQAASAKVDQAQTQVAEIAKGEVEKARHADKFYMKGITITPGGFLELAGIYRQHAMSQDLPTSFQNIPFPNNVPGRQQEGRFSARQSRLSFLAEGVVNPHLKLGMYGEFDFLGAAQTANSNQTNSYNPRIRHIYGTVDWINGNNGFHLLAGQNWSLITMNSKGITPRNEVTPPQIDAQYVPGFAFARQPQVRLAGDFMDHHLWIAVSAENPQTTTGGTIPGTVVQPIAGSGGFNSLVSPSFNHVPDVIGKVAYEGTPGGHTLHIEALAIYRNFSERLTGPVARNLEKSGGGFGGSIALNVVPKILDVQFSGLTGKGIGRYGAGQLPDITFAPDGTIRTLKETMLLAGATLHVTKMLDLYGFAGEEYVERPVTFGTTTNGWGSPFQNNTGCLSLTNTTCSGNNRIIRQLTFGFWQKLYQGPFGRAQVGAQYSHTERQLFDAIGGAPRASQNMGFISFRYYPF
jgi:hypothetical protein